jgi:hypothetical protein
MPQQLRRSSRNEHSLDHLQDVHDLRIEASLCCVSTSACSEARHATAQPPWSPPCPCRSGSLRHNFCQQAAHLCVLLLRVRQLFVPAALQVVVLRLARHDDAVLRDGIPLVLQGLLAQHSAHRRAAQEPRDRRQGGRRCAPADGSWNYLHLVSRMECQQSVDLLVWMQPDRSWTKAFNAQLMVQFQCNVPA